MYFERNSSKFKLKTYRTGQPFGCHRCQGFDDNGPDSGDDGTPDACDDCTLPGDINCDGIVNLLDQALLALHCLETI
jgi:hypothetical protein